MPKSKSAIRKAGATVTPRPPVRRVSGAMRWPSQIREPRS